MPGEGVPCLDRRGQMVYQIQAMKVVKDEDNPTLSSLGGVIGKPRVATESICQKGMAAAFLTLHFRDLKGQQDAPLTATVEISFIAEALVTAHPALPNISSAHCFPEGVLINGITSLIIIHFHNASFLHLQ